MGPREILRGRSAEHDDVGEDERNLDKYKQGGKRIDFTNCGVLERDPVLDSGAWVFSGTSIMLKQVLWYIAENHNLDETVKEFYGEVDREAIAEVLRYMGEQLSTKEP